MDFFLPSLTLYFSSIIIFGHTNISQSRCKVFIYPQKNPKVSNCNTETFIFLCVWISVHIGLRLLLFLHFRWKSQDALVIRVTGPDFVETVVFNICWQIPIFIRKYIFGHIHFRHLSNTPVSCLTLVNSKSLLFKWFFGSLRRLVCLSQHYMENNLRWNPIYIFWCKPTTSVNLFLSST